MKEKSITSKKRRILVTGGAGFIGSNVVELLTSKKYEIIILDNLSTGNLDNIPKTSNIEFVSGDIRDKKLINRLVKKVNGIFHLAATVGNVKSIENPWHDAEVNVLGTINILEAAKENNIQKVVFSSSGAIFGEVSYLPVDEKHPTEPDSPYGVTKLASEKHCLCYSRIYNIDIVCLRYFNVYGKNQRYNPYGNVIPIWANCIQKNKPITIYGDGEQTRDFINVKDVAIANIQAFETQGVNGAFNIGSGRSITINQLSKLFKEVSDSEFDIRYTSSRKGEVLHSRANIDKAQSDFNFKPQIKFNDGIREYFEWIELK